MSRAMPDLLTAGLRIQARLLHEAVNLGTEALDFARLRLERDRALMARLAASSDRAAMMSLWSEAWSEVMTDYADGAGRMGVLASATAERLMAGATDEARALMPQTNAREGASP
jgi:hypothetical protein